SGLDCITLPIFRELFSDHILSSDGSLHIHNVALLFTDIKGSTHLYEALGDVSAYKAVSLHFKLLFENVSQNHGVIIKTIGDAVMASFTQPEHAMSAALDAQKAFKEFRPLYPESEETIVVKMGIHHGSCIAV